MLRLYFSGSLKRNGASESKVKNKIEALSTNKLFCRKAKHKAHCSLLIAH
ncbi:MAG: hypothetical protein II131_00375 [Neisseriaceae bacterium]|nr:hypothetical protein [Neisseriaceae bacterium]